MCPLKDMFGVHSQAVQHPEHYEPSRTSDLKKQTQPQTQIAEIGIKSR